MDYRAVTSRKAVIDAIQECDRLGREAFQERYGFGASKTYYLRFGGNEYDSKPIIAVAHKYQFPDEGALRNEFSGGRNHAARHLVRLGFEVDGLKPGPNDWTLDEVELVVGEYFDLFERDRAGEHANKAAHYAAVARRLPRRNEGAVSRKYGNISATLRKLELPWVPGVTPQDNRQALLVAVVIDWIADHPDFFSDAPVQKRSPPTIAAGVEVDPPSGAQFDAASDARRASRVDFAKRDERNRKLGRAGEEWAVEYLKQELRDAGRADLADGVRWVADLEGDGLGYDIASFDVAGKELFVEVKTTNGAVGAPFLLTRNELSASEAMPGYVLLRLFDFGGTPRFYRLEGNLRERCHLDPQLYRARPA